jgi:serine/threonine protein phosphatase 1
VTTEIAFVGDVHGNLDALRGLSDLLTTVGEPHTVFLGDYINKGAQSAEVMNEVIARSRTGLSTLLLGNHEATMLEALDTGDLAAFLKMGGAATIRSYVGADVGPDVLLDFRASVPIEHLEAIQIMGTTFELEDVIAQHISPSVSSSKFRIGAHFPVGQLPQIEPHSAQIDTGCGTRAGRLTALLWPSLDYLQVDAHGSAVARGTGAIGPPSHSDS